MDRLSTEIKTLTMKNTIIKGEGIYYDIHDKPFWAAFFNLARHNVFITINHINQKLELPMIQNDKDLLQVKNFWKNGSINTDLLKKGKLQELILKHFPFIQSVAYGEKSYEVYNELKNKEARRNKEDKQKEQSEALSLDTLIDLLAQFFSKLKEFRNYYSHHKHPNTTQIPKFDDSILNQLYNVLDTNVRLVKEDHKSNEKIDINEDFDHLIRKSKGGNNHNFRYHFRNKKEIVTKEGLLFFVSLFLEKRDAIWMQKKIRGFKAGDKGYKQMTNEVFCRSRMVLPKLKLESSYDDNQILLDMLNELARCPKSLFERLEQKDRDKFKVPIEQLEDNTEKDDNQDEEENPFKNLLLRNKDRFPYFALRYFDGNEILPTLRFQVDLGNYHFSIYNKIIGDNLEKRHLTRNLFGFQRIQKFLTEQQPEEWKALVKDLDYYESPDLPFISKTSPHYHLEANKIGFKFVNNLDTLYPPLQVENQNGSKKAKYKYDSHFVADAFMSVHELAPMMFYYLLLKNNDEAQVAGNKVEGVLKRVKNNIFGIYDEFKKGSINSIEELNHQLEGKSLFMSHFPKQMINILKNTSKNMQQEADRKIKELIEDSERRKKKLEEQIHQKIRIGKSKSGLLKSGIIADWLVRDLMGFQPVAYDSSGQPLNRSKANSTEYQLLQRTFALFGGEKDRLPQYLKQMNLVDSKNEHPFLSKFKWDSQPNIMAFYKKYLDKRVEYLEGLKPKDWGKYQYFLKLKVPKDNRETLVAGWKNGFNMPRGLFTEPIKQWFQNQSNKGQDWKELNEKIQKLDRAGFIARAIPLYFKTIHQDESQEFYNFSFNVSNPQKPKKGLYLNKEDRKKLWEKNKSIFNEKSLSNWEQNTQKDVEKFFQELGRVKGNNEKKNRIEEYLKSLQLWNEFKEDIDKNRFNLLKNVLDKIPKLSQYFKSWQKFEKELRLIRNQDMLMWLMCKELHNQTMVEQLEIEKLFLKHLKVDVTDRAEKEAPTQSINVLNRVVAMKLPVTTYKTNDKGAVLKKEPLETFYIEENQTKLLKQGNFKALVKDRRLNGLFSFIDVNGNCPKDHPISKKDLEYELGKYQTTRIEIFKSTLELEKRMLEKYPDLPADNFKQMLQKWQEKKSNGKDFNNIVKALVAVRNAFSHNQYPMYDEDLFGKKTYLLGTSEGNLDIAIKLQEETVKNVTLITNSL